MKKLTNLNVSGTTIQTKGIPSADWIAHKQTHTHRTHILVMVISSRRSQSKRKSTYPSANIQKLECAELK